MSNLLTEDHEGTLISVAEITLFWAPFGLVRCDYDSRGWSYDFEQARAAKDEEGRFLIPPHTTMEEITQRFEEELCETRIGKYMGDLVDGTTDV